MGGFVWLVMACGRPGDTSAGGEDAPPAGVGVEGDSADSGSGDPVEPPGGPACLAWGEPVLAGEVHADLYEISAIVASWRNPGVLWVLQDAYNEPVLHAMDATGNALGTLTLDGVENIDWEALAVGVCDEGTCLWVGDIGNNRQDREEVRLLRVPEPEVPAGGGMALHATPAVFPLVYAEGAVDAEALAVTPDGTPVIVSKRYDWTAGIYLVEDPNPGVVGTPVRVGTLSTARDGETDMEGAVTAADLWPDGSRLLIRTYGRVWEFDVPEGGVAGIGAAPRAELPFAAWEHAEGVAYDARARGYWQVEEWGHAPLWFVPCLDGHTLATIPG